MAKRGNDNSQLTKEEVEALDNQEGGNAGTYSKADAGTISKRKIIRGAAS
jgi:hypothetical protein